MIKKSRQAGVTMLEVIIAAILLAGVFAMTFMVLGSTSESTARAQIQLELEDRARRVVTEITQDIKMSRTTAFMCGGGGQGITETLSSSDTRATTTVGAGAFNTYPWNDIRFRTQSVDNTGFSLNTFSTAPETYWNREIRYTLIMDTGEDGVATPNNLDDNRNGVVDEMAIRKIIQPINGVTGAASGNPTTSVICRDVQKNGLQIKYLATQNGQAAQKFEITLTLEKRDPRFKTSITKTVTTFVDFRN